ncbi:MAG: Fe2+-dependent dioxygenase [Hydrogenophaga sp.]|nr:Fe2+-dependent dioxygenase [Hydrogenophaga sp.]MDP2096502.1 Fe2+-dependent dioxygenase [Hydrogenophaga sp.]MDP2219336.1 Fe2+-dependent dioxygenase [Hydrogenophaga sp.]MDP3924931.1 Fe2+-dependent dioxygenase [Hydrogenophaga sp.]MDZ4239690.1 Fe2+-dependent dioxygenase [Hydrogenophaga sp.]
MILVLKNLFSPEELASIRSDLGPQAPWISGASSAGGQAVTQKNNQQLAQDSALAKALQQRILHAVQADPLFFSAALPHKIFNPLFNRYSGASNHYGPHIDGAVLHSRQTGERVRTDLSCTVFLNDPADYGGGELTVHDTYGAQSIKLPAGHAVLYPGTSLHEVRPVTRGERLASFFWIQSMVRSDEQRRLLFDLDMNLLKLRQQHGETAETTALTGTYHNLLRMWAAV